MTSIKKPVRIFHNARVHGLAVLLMIVFAAPVCVAKKGYLSEKQQPDILALLPPPPVGVEQAADMASVMAVHNAASSNELAGAKMEGNFSVFVFTPAIGDFFQPGKFPKTEAFFKRVRRDSDHIVDFGKEHWKRLRPINANPALNWGVRDSSYSYPSGHSTRATIYALLLAEIFPERKDEILAIGRQTGWHRVEMAVHYPTDIFAGRVLARAVVRQLKTDAKFQRDFAEVKAELTAAKTEAGNLKK
ncbi:MAG TPA: phosphatase PAP2 family protein [Verrucomicrobiae bacterium]|nr:phosphatase PAP2 family protein [Verrucomicrobiae bacterium]